MTSLERRLGPLDAAAIVVSNVIGGGIFFVPILVAGFTRDPRAMLVVWLAGGTFAFMGAMAYAELAALRPRAGGEYVYLREAFGPLAAFLTGWTSFVAGFSGAIAASAVALAEYIGRFWPAAGDAAALFQLPLPLVPRSPDAVQRISATTRVPTVAIVAQSIWSGVLVLCGSLAQLVSYTGFALVLFSGIAVAAVFVLRRREPDAPRPFRAWGYPIAPGVFVAACAVMVANELWRNPGTSAAGVAIIIAGVPVFAWSRRGVRALQNA